MAAIQLVDSGRFAEGAVEASVWYRSVVCCVGPERKAQVRECTSSSL